MTNRRSKYKFRRAAVSAALIATLSAPAWAADVPALVVAQIQGLSENGQAKVELFWNAVAGSGPVTYSVGLNQDGSNTFNDAVTATEAKYLFSTLLPGTTYYFAVASIELVGDKTQRSSWSSSVKVTTDSDPDNDGILTSVECPGFTNCPDTDQDGVPNSLDNDDDNDGTLTAAEYSAEDGSVLDTDGDSIPDYLEPNTIDTDNDGFMNNDDADDDGDSILTESEVGDILTPTDSDSDDIYDYLDIASAGINDSDGDGLTDTQECNKTPFCTNDYDQDGLTDYLDSTDDTPVTPEATPDVDTDTGLKTGIDGAGGGSLGLGMLAGLMGLGAVRRRRQSLVSKALPLAVASVLVAAVPVNLEAGETQWYLGMGLGTTNLDPDTSGIAGVDVKENRSTGGKLFAGYDFTSHWTLEGFVADLGESTLTDGVDVGYELYGLSGIYHFPGSLPGWTFLAKAGVANLSNNTIKAYEQENDTQAFVGIGGEYQLANKLSLRGEYEYFAEDADMLSMNLLVRFGDVPVPEVKVVERTIEVPVVQPPEGDADADGVVDSKDRCPNTPPGMKVDANGCVFDLDGDGVLNVDDECPDTPRGMAVHANGCPKFTGVLEGVKFELDKATLTGESKAILAKVATELMSYPSLKVIIVGHTDSQGSDNYNNKLSLERAKSVAAFLTSQGVRGERLKYAGYGERFPRADNTTTAGRAQNRRVELLPMK